MWQGSCVLWQGSGIMIEGSCIMAAGVGTAVIGADAARYARHRLTTLLKHRLHVLSLLLDLQAHGLMNTSHLNSMKY